MLEMTQLGTIIDSDGIHVTETEAIGIRSAGHVTVALAPKLVVAIYQEGATEPSFLHRASLQ